MPSIRAGFTAAACVLLMPGAMYGQSSKTEREFSEGDFAVSISHDALTDENTSQILSISENEEGALAWKCMEDGLNVLLAIGDPYKGDDDGDMLVQYRFDDLEAAPQEYWSLIGGGKLGYIRMDKVADFTAAARGARKIAVRAVDPYDDETRTFVFSLKGLDKAISNLPCAD